MAGRLDDEMDAFWAEKRRRAAERHQAVSKAYAIVVIAGAVLALAFALAFVESV